MKHLFYILVLFVVISCTKGNEEQENSSVSTIDIEKELKDFKIRKLSDFAKNLRYVRLETKENCLISGAIKKIYYEKGKIIVMDGDPYLKVFDGYSGKYLYNIGSKGQGPGELPYLYSTDINAEKDVVLLNWGEYSNQFNLNGKFLKSNTSPTLLDKKQSIAANRIAIDTNLYAAGIHYVGEKQSILTIIFNGEKQIIDTTECYENFIQCHIKVYSLFGQSGVFYRVPNNIIRYYRGLSDTIYAYNAKKQTFLPAFCVNYGKHRASRKTHPNERNKDKIEIRQLCENKRYLFFDFETIKASPEPFEDEIYRGGQYLKFTNNSILGVFDKRTKSFDFLLQPIPAIKGLQNDIDNGIPFNVKNVSSKGELITYYQSYKFLEYAEKLKNPKDSFKKILKQIKEDDNPIVVIAE